MNSLIGKGAVGVLGSSVVVGVTTITLGSSETKTPEKPQSIASLLGKNHPEKRLLFEIRGADNADGRSAGKRYVAAYSGLDKNPFSVNAVIEGQGNAPVPFMKKCEALFKEEVLNADSEKYEQALEYCTRDTLVSDFVGTAGKKLIDTEQEGRASGGRYYQNGDDIWGLKVSGVVAGQVPQSFKNKCNQEFAVKTGNPQHPSVERFLNYCSKTR